MSEPTVRKLRDLAVPLLALRVLLSEFPDLPSGYFRVSDIYPDQLDMSLHDDLAAFERWRDALGIAPESVTCGDQSGGRTRVLEAECDYAGARICLTGFSTVPEHSGGAE